MIEVANILDEARLNIDKERNLPIDVAEPGFHLKLTNKSLWLFRSSKVKKRPERERESSLVLLPGTQTFSGWSLDLLDATASIESAIPFNYGLASLSRKDRPMFALSSTWTLPRCLRTQKHSKRLHGVRSNHWASFWVEREIERLSIEFIWLPSKNMVYALIFFPKSLSLVKNNVPVVLNEKFGHWNNHLRRCSVRSLNNKGNTIFSIAIFNRWPHTNSSFFVCRLLRLKF